MARRRVNTGLRKAIDDRDKNEVLWAITSEMANRFSSLTDVREIASYANVMIKAVSLIPDPVVDDNMKSDDGKKVAAVADLQARRNKRVSGG